MSNKFQYISELVSKSHNLNSDAVTEAADALIDALEYEMVNNSPVKSMSDDIMGDLFDGLFTHGLAIANGEA